MAEKKKTTSQTPESKQGERCVCSCGGAVKLVFPCSGGSDVGEIADHAARKLTREGLCKMNCIAGIGGRVSGIMATAEAASAILVIDGCPLSCGRRTFEQAGFKNFEYLQLADLGIQKGRTPPSPETVARVAEAGAAKLK